jgi:hypothetical protein
VTRKGGNPVPSTLRPEVADQVAQSRVAVPEALGDLAERLPLDDRGAERLVAHVWGGGARVGGPGAQKPLVFQGIRGGGLALTPKV